ncbi:hypothetical protein A9Q91_04215 [Candidatus Gracilibacteria bacterium 28_42_T64]|nr:hypothetical protein A9Q91_04215 [Candidatus Gracilibacteria bacterium 28_42_T64]
MKNINLRIYTLSVLFFFLGIFVYYMTKGATHNYFITLFIGVTLTIGLINTSSILFYKTLKTNDEYLKYVFSFIHIIGLITLSFILVPF